MIDERFARHLCAHFNLRFSSRPPSIPFFFIPRELRIAKSGGSAVAKKLAVTIAGAVSLGSYESGVAFEIFDAIAQHNQWAETNHLPDERIEIDVLTGASAGGMTVAMLAQRLLFDGPAMGQPYNNPLYNAWVQDVDIVGLLKRQSDEDMSHSVFSSDLVVTISRRYLTARYASLPLPPAQPHPALPLNGQLQLGLALSNLNGVDYSRPTSSGGQFTYTAHEDHLLRAIDRQSGDRAELWETIRAAAVACGAFPVAFRVQDLVRNICEYSSPYLVRKLWDNSPSRYFTYTDGGLFQNQPIGMAKNLVERLPGSRLDAENRGYLFIAPQPKTSSAIAYTNDAAADPAKAFGSANANYKAVAERLAGAVLGQSEFQDWIEAERINEHLRLLDQRAGELQALFLGGALTPAQTDSVAAVLLRPFFEGDDALTQSLDRARNQLRTQYQPKYDAFGDNRAAADAWLDAVLVLELAANLHEKEEMLIYDFVADTKHLASNGLSAFESFFDQRFRKHDYDYGRSVGQTRLASYRARPNSLFTNLHWTPKPIDPIDPNLDNFDMSKVDRAKREQVCQQMSDAANTLLQELDLSWPVRKAVMYFFIDKQIEKMLAL